MTSGHYILNDSVTKTNARADTSFRSCILTLFVFLLLCVIVFIVLSLTPKGGRHSLTGGEGGSEAHHSKQKGTLTVRPSEGDKRASEEATERATSSTESTFRAFSPPAGNDSTETVTEYTDSPKSGRSEDDEVLNTSPSPIPDDRLPPPPPPVLQTIPPTTPPPAVTTIPSTSPPPVVTTIPSTFPQPVLPTIPSTYPPPAVPTIISTPATPLEREICEDEGCKELAANILHTMGHGADPCSDFYEYACGGLLHNRYLLEPDYPNEAYQRIKGAIDNLKDADPTSFKKLKKLEESCRQYDPHKDIQKWKNSVLEEITYLGGISKDSKIFKENFTKIFLGFLKFDRPIIAEMNLDVNDLEPHTFLLNFFSANLFKDQIIQDDDTETVCQSQLNKTIGDIRNRYKNIKDCLRVMEKINLLRAAEEGLRNLNIFTSEEETKLQETLNDYETFLNINTEAFGKIERRRLEVQSREINNKTIGNMNELFYQLNVNWTYIVNTLVNESMNDDEIVQIYSESYFEELIPELNESMSKHRLHNALLVAFVAERYRNLVEAQQFWRRSQPFLHCTRLATLLLPDVASALYMRTFDRSELSILEKEIGNAYFDVSEAYKDAISGSKWFSDESNLRTGLDYKVGRIKNFNISGDPNLRDIEHLDKNLRMYEINETDFIHNALMLMKRNRKQIYERFNKDPANYIASHFALPYGTEGVCIYSLKSAMIPLGVIEKPFFLPSYLPHIKTAGLGFVFAREIAHHLDKIGIKFDCLNETEDFTYYENKLPTLPKDAIGTHERIGDTHIRDLKYNEWLADRFGIKIAFRAFNDTDKKKKKGELPKTLPFLPLTNDQQFFVFMAQKYCTKDIISYVDLFESEYFPPKMRVEQMFNIKEFNEAFKCGEKTKESDDFPFPEPRGEYRGY